MKKVIQPVELDGHNPADELHLRNFDLTVSERSRWNLSMQDHRDLNHRDELQTSQTDNCWNWSVHDENCIGGTSLAPEDCWNLSLQDHKNVKPQETKKNKEH